jgi:hypothetical protein
MEAENKMRKGGMKLLDDPDDNKDVPYGFHETKPDKE